MDSIEFQRQLQSELSNEILEIQALVIDQIWEYFQNTASTSTLPENFGKIPKTLPKSCDFLQKLLYNLYSIVPTSGSGSRSQFQLSSKVFGQISAFILSLLTKISSSSPTFDELEKLESTLTNANRISESSDKNTNKTEEEDWKTLMKLLQISNTILDNVGNVSENQNQQFDQHEVNCFVEQVTKLFRSITEFLMNPKIKMEKSMYIQLILTCRKSWNFLKPEKVDYSIVQHFSEFVMSKMDFLNFFASDNTNCVLFLRFFLEIVDVPQSTQVKRINWEKFLQKIPNDSPKLLSILLEKQPGIFTREIITHVQSWLNSEDAETRKEAAFILKLVTSSLAEAESKSNENYSSDQNQMLLYLGKEKFMKFWSDYFDLYEILSEKQIHIIEPVLKEKLLIFNEMDNFKCQWYLVILTKMVHHDNRLVAKEGFFRFLAIADELQEQKQNQNLDKKSITNFLDLEIIPLLKEHVGWVLSEATDFFKFVPDFGKMLYLLYDSDELSIIGKVMSIITQEGKCLSPACTFFLVLSLDSKEAIKLRKACPIYLSNEENAKLKQTLMLITQCVTQGLRTTEKFMRIRIENTFVDILNRWKGYLSALCGEKDPEDLCPQLLSFIGSLSLETIQKETSMSTNSKGLVEVVNVFKGISGLNFSGYRALDRSIKKLYSSKAQIKGVFRWVWLNCLTNEDYFKAVKTEGLLKLSNSIPDVMNPAEAFGEFILCVTSSLSSSSEFEEFQNILKADCLEKLENLCIKIRKPIPNTKLLQEFCTTVQFIEICVNNSAVGEKRIRFPYSLLWSEEVMKKNLLNKDTVNYPTVFAFWKLLALLPDEHEKEIIQQLVTLFEDSNGICSKNSNNFDGILEMYLQCFGLKLLSEFYQVKFDSFAHVLNNFATWKNSHSTELGVDIWKRCIVSGIEQVEMAGPGGVVQAARFFTALLPFLQAYPTESLLEINDMLIKFVNLAWNLVFEMRKTDTFWAGMEEFVDFITHPYFAGQGILKNVAEKIFQHGETINGLPLVLIEKLKERFQKCPTDILENEKGLEEFVDVCLIATWAGPAISKQIRFSYDLWEFLNKQNEVSKNPDKANDGNFTANVRTRLISTQLLVSILTGLKDGSKNLKDKYCLILRRIVASLLNSNDNGFPKRYFKNSITHRKKQRIAQTLLILQPFFDQELDALVMRRLLASLEATSPQPSVRYFCEWIVIRILSKSTTLWDAFFETCSQCSSSRSGFASFFCSICLHTSKILQNSEVDKQFLEKALFTMTELVLGHHSTVRVYAQVCFQGIFQRIDSFGWTDLTDKYRVIFDSLSGTIRNSQGNSAKMFAGVRKDFYIQVFHPETHFVPEVIFTELPRVSGMASDELPLDSDFLGTELIKVEGNSHKLSRKALRELYLKNDNMLWHIQSTGVDGREMGDEEWTAEAVTQKAEESFTTSVVNFQKKINPWKYLSVADQLEDFSVEFLSKKHSAMEDGLIVVASLIDRIPNLGGLCRSCEIFGVSTYVIPAMRILEDNIFQNLSVSSHNWVNILEVTPRDLEGFLSTYAAKGYKILGVEQALESTPLNDFVFPKKSLLLLGNEKFGIPTNLLHLVEKCIEIPQVGVVRSLNVHVTGALCIWQYASQHAF